MHKCSKNDCPTANVAGPTIKCIKCKNLCYLKCFGFEKVATVESIDAIKFLLPDGGAFFSFVPHSAFVCCESSVSTTDLKSAFKLPKAKRGTSASRATKTNETDENAPVAAELNEIKNLIQKNAIVLNEIKAIAEESNANMKLSQRNAMFGHMAAHVSSITNTPTTSLVGGQRKVMTAKRKLETNTKPKKQLIDDLPKPLD